MGHLLSVTSTPFKDDLHKYLPQFWQCLALNFEDKLVEKAFPTAKKLIWMYVLCFVLLKY